MAQDSRRQRRVRRLRRERSQLRRAIGFQRNQLMTEIKLRMDAQAGLRALKPVPSYTIKTLPDEDTTPETVDTIGHIQTEERHDIPADINPS